MRPVSVLLALVLIPTQLIALTYLDYAHILAKEGIINEREDDTRYRVDDLVWRQEVIGMAVNINDDIDLERYACTGVFNDITTATPNRWICRAAEAAADHGIITRGRDYPHTRIGVRPEQNITRAEALAVIWDALGIARADDSIAGQYSYSSDTVYWQKILLAAAYERGIIESTSTFGPNENATRGEIFEIIAKLKGLVPIDNSTLDPELEGLFDELLEMLQSL